MDKKVTKLVLPVAGLGKRLMPLTKTTPKNLVVVNGKPLLEYVLEEAVESGIKDVILVVGPKHKKHFAAYLRENAKRFPTLTFHTRIQEAPGGNGHAIAQAYDLVKGEPFAVRFCDDIIVSNQPVLKSLIDIFNERQASVILLKRVPMDMVSHFGVVGFNHEKTPASFRGGDIYEINTIVEKPKREDAPSNLTVVGGYVFTADLGKNLRIIADTLSVVADDALPIAVALQVQLILKDKVYGWEFAGRWLDCGTPEKLQEAEKELKRREEKADLQFASL